MTTKISPNAEVDPHCQIGSDVHIDSFTKVSGDVKIGKGTWIGSNVTIFDGTRIGENCRIFPGAVIGAIPQDLKFKGEKTVVEIGHRTTIRECVTINRGTSSRGYTRIGHDCLLMAYTHVAHDNVIGNYCIIANGVQIGGEVEISDWVVLGGSVNIHQFCKIGKHAMVAGMSGILTDIPPYVTAAGVPVVYQGINYIGLKRRSFSKESIDRIHEIYRVIYQSSMNTTQALEYMEKNVEPGLEKSEIMTFIKNATRGIIKGKRDNGNRN